VPGCAGATAITVGVHAGRPTAWAALYSEAADSTELALIDVENASAACVAVLRGDAEDAGDSSGSARLERLAWDGQRLLAAGDPGLVSFEPPAL
jgi:hypothetical protein